MSEAVQIALINLASNVVFWVGNTVLGLLVIWRIRLTVRAENRRQTSEIRPILEERIQPAVEEIKKAIVENGHGDK